MHSERLDFFTAQYEKEKRTMLSQYAEEMDSYKTRKFCVQRELDCVQFGLEDTDEQQRRSVENEHRDDIDRIKSKVSSRSSQHQHSVVEVLTVGLGSFCHALRNRL